MPPGAEGARWRRDVRNEKEQWRRRGLKKLKRTWGSWRGPAMRYEFREILNKIVRVPKISQFLEESASFC